MNFELPRSAMSFENASKYAYVQNETAFIYLITFNNLNHSTPFKFQLLQLY